jgi:RHH-type rel operon transcriptional repressor/antitoxin RelB
MKAENLKTKKPVISLRVPASLYKKIGRIAQATKHSQADLLLHWVEQAVILEEWQIQEIVAGIKEADAGLFATETEIDRVLNKWL